MSDTLAARAVDRFRRSFPGAAEPGVVFAPHRVELMGSSTVAQQGVALLCADLRAVALAFRPRADRALRQADLLPVDPRPLTEVANALRERGLDVPGMDFAVHDGHDAEQADTPLRVAAALAMLHLAGKELPRVELAKLCGDPHRPTGPADALALLLGRKDHCVHLDCRTWSHELLALDPGYDFVIAETGAAKVPPRQGRAELLADAVARLARYDPTITHLRDVKPEMIEDHFEQMPRDRSAGAVHVVDEIRRVGEAAAALRQGRMADFGRLLSESHASLRDDFDAVPRETDALARIACGQPGTAGARAIGSGAAIVALVEHASADRLRSALEHEFFREYGRRPTVTRMRPGAGASVLQECPRE